MRALEAVAQGYRAPVRHILIAEERSVGLYPGTKRDRVKHDCLGERLKFYRKKLRAAIKSGAADTYLWDVVAVLQDQYDARLRGEDE